MFDFEKNFANAHNEARCDELLKAHGFLRTVPTALQEDPAQTYLPKIPVHLEFLLPERAEADFSEEHDPLTKLFSDMELDFAMGNKPSPISDSEIRFGMMKASLADEEYLLSHGAGALPTNNGGELNKSAHSRAREAIFGYVNRCLGRGITRQEILKLIHSGGATDEDIALVEEACRVAA